MTNVSSYDTGYKRYKHDVTRGKWSSKWDFLAVCLGHSFGINHFTMMSYVLVSFGGLLFVVPYFICMFIYSIPVFMVQSFLGQFSSSGSISAFRIAPLFKGIGYVILMLNLTTVTYFVGIAATSFVYLANSLNPKLPWMSCDNAWNSPNCTTDYPDGVFYAYGSIPWSTKEFYNHELALDNSSHQLQISWRIVGSVTIVWMLIGCLVINGAEMMGKIIRFSTILIAIILIVILVRLLCLEGAWRVFEEFLIPKWELLMSPSLWIGSQATTTVIFGAGWGTVLTMASFNNFQHDIGKSAFLINFVHIGMFAIGGIYTKIAKVYLTETLKYNVFMLQQHVNMYISFSYLFGKLSAPNLWSMLFFLMVFLGELISCAVQVLTIVTALFDEYDKLRIYKKEFTGLLLTLLFFISITFCFNSAFSMVSFVLYLSTASQLLICFIELMVVVWVYGRKRFQQDITFMTGKKYATWKFLMIRFLTPFIVLIIFLFQLFMATFTIMHTDGLSVIMAFLLKFLPMILIPTFIGYQLYNATGTFCDRLKKLCKPNDWYPADSNDRHRYDLLANKEDNHDHLMDYLNMNIGEMTAENIP